MKQSGIKEVAAAAGVGRDGIIRAFGNRPTLRSDTQAGAGDGGWVVLQSFLRDEGGRDRPLSCRQYGELLGQGGIGIQRVPCLSLSARPRKKSGLRRQLDEVAARHVEGAIADDADIGTVTTASSMTP
ncbi:hypothetical protein NKJ35_17010 [Mesorhizobium sp. M0136]|uniref:hypothetical protein n=1 Tax=Mesorhizobium sp. M0136 TaxID=2956890 RepID=UPI0033361E8F